MQRDELKRGMLAFMERAGVPKTEFDPEFVVKMIEAMMVSFHKYGRVAEAYPDRCDALKDMFTRRGEYRRTGNLHFLVDVANFAMIEAMHPASANAHWGRNDADNSPGRNTHAGQLSKDDNHGHRTTDVILHTEHLDDVHPAQPADDENAGSAGRSAGS